jgi:hypothetical protein
MSAGSGGINTSRTVPQWADGVEKVPDEMGVARYLSV